MGVRGLLKFTQKFPSINRTESISTVSGYRLAVDGNNLMHYIYDDVESYIFVPNRIKKQQQHAANRKSSSDCPCLKLPTPEDECSEFHSAALSDKHHHHHLHPPEECNCEPKVVP